MFQVPANPASGMLCCGTISMVRKPKPDGSA